jgi:RNA polymerase sigma-70 factor, ECF subfamily
LAIGVIDESEGASPTATEPVVASIEATLVARAAAGDARAFRQIYDRHARALFRFTCDLLRDAPAAEEALQETFVRAHARLGTLRDGDKLRAWLYGIARLVVMETVRARRGGADDESVLEHTASGAPSPEAMLISREASRALDAALAELRPERRAALLMTADAELSYDDIARAMSWSLAKVKVEIHRARLELRARMAEHLGGKQS